MRAWIFHSPLRFALVALAAVTAVAVPVLATSHGGQQGRPLPVASTAPAPRQLDPEEAERAAEEFVAVWCELGNRTPEQWEAEMRARSTPEFAPAWSANQASFLTGDCFWGHTDTRWITATEALEVVDTKRGRPVLVRVQQVGDKVLVADITGDQGGD